MLNHALEYIRLGLAVFPLHSINNGVCTCGNPDCKSPGKHPIAAAAPHGFKNATTNPNLVSKWWQEYPWANIAIATGSYSGNLLVVDIDNKPERGMLGEENWYELCGGPAKEPDTVISNTGSGGKHLLFKYPQGVLVKSGQNTLGGAIDTRAENGYIVAPPSKHKSGKNYEWSDDGDITNTLILDAPQWLLVKLAQGKPGSNGNQPQPADRVFSKLQYREIRSALTHINPDDRDLWLEVGMALHSTRTGPQAFGLWTEWSQISDKYNAPDQRRVWNSFNYEGDISLNTLFLRAKQNGWIMPEAQTTGTVNATQQTPERKEISIPPKLYDPPGNFGILVDYITETSHFPQPAFACNGALSFCGAVLGGRVQGSTGVRSNVYTVSVGPTACGKEHPMTAIKEIALTVGLAESHLGGEGIASGQAILSRLEKTKNVLFQLDEFGLMLQSLQGKGSGRHSAEILKNLMSLFSKSNTIYYSTEYADQKARPRVELDYPCACLHGVSTGSELYKSFGSAHVVNGFLNRLILVDPGIKTRGERVRTPRALRDIPGEVITTFEQIKELKGPGNISDITGANPLVVPKEKYVDDYFDQIEEFIGRQYNRGIGVGEEGIWGRVYEQCEKVALIISSFNNPEEPRITQAEAEWSCNYVIYHAFKAVQAVRDNVADSEYEQYKKGILRVIKSGGKRGKTEYEIRRVQPASSLKPIQRREILDDLQEGGYIDFVEFPGKGRVRKAYITIEEN